MSLTFQQQIFIESMKLYAKHHKHHGDGDSAMLESSGEEEDEAGEGKVATMMKAFCSVSRLV